MVHAWTCFSEVSGLSCRGAQTYFQRCLDILFKCPVLLSVVSGLQRCPNLCSEMSGYLLFRAVWTDFLRCPDFFSEVSRFVVRDVGTLCQRCPDLFPEVSGLLFRGVRTDLQICLDIVPHLRTVGGLLGGLMGDCWWTVRGARTPLTREGHTQK